MKVSDVEFFIICVCLLFNCLSALKIADFRCKNYCYRTHRIYQSTKVDVNVADEASSETKVGNGISYSGSSGSALSLQSVSVSVGNYDILNQLNWEIMPKERWGIVGRNGAGKSTLLRTIISGSSGNIAIQSGSINVAKKSRIGYLEQKGVSGSTLTLREEVR